MNTMWTAMLLHVMLLVSSGSAESICRSKSPSRLVPGQPGVKTGSDTYVFRNYGIECSGRVTAVVLFATLEASSGDIWNETLRLNLLFLEAERTGYTLKATIPVSVASSDLTAELVDLIHLSATQIILADVTIVPAFTTIGIELPAASINGNSTVYNHIPLLNIMNTKRCDSTVNITTDSGATRLYCPSTEPPLILTVEENHTDCNTTPVTVERCSSCGSEPAKVFMVFVIGILLLVVVVLATSLVLVTVKFRQLRKKRQDSDTQDESTRYTAMYSHIAEQEAVYEELPYSSDHDLATGHTKAPAYHTIKEATTAHTSSATITHRMKPCTTSQSENAYNVLHVHDAEDATEQYQDLTDGECTGNDGNYRMLDADTEPSSYSVHHYHVVDRSTEENQYHTLENDVELTAGSCVENQYHVVESNSDKEHVYHTLEIAEATAEDVTDAHSSGQGPYMNMNTTDGYTLSNVRAPSDMEGSTSSSNDESAHHTCESGAAEKPYHVLEVEETSEYQALNETKEDDHAYQTPAQVADYGGNDHAYIAS